MRALVQRVKSARVTVESKVVGEIGPGLLTFLGVSHQDTESHARKVIDKVSKLRIFEDSDGKMNLSLLDPSLGLSHLIVSQFTLYADTSKGNRPSFIQAAPPPLARQLYEFAIDYSRSLGIPTATGSFQATMEVELKNDGPATFLIEIEE